MKLVRLYPRNPKKGWVIQTYVDPFIGLKFVATKGWYEVSDEIAEKLSIVKQKEYDPESKNAFLIANNDKDAKRIEDTVINPRIDEKSSIGTSNSPIKTDRFRPGKRGGKVRIKSRMTE
jgi:hypothetical protein